MFINESEHVKKLINWKVLQLFLFLTCVMVTCNVVFTKWIESKKDELTFVDNPVESAFPGHWLPVSIVKRIMEMRVRTTTGLYQTLKRLSKEIRQPLYLKRNTTIKNVILYGTTKSSVLSKQTVNLTNDNDFQDSTQTTVSAMDVSTSTKTNSLSNLSDLFSTISRTDVIPSSLCTSTLITSENPTSAIAEITPETTKTIMEMVSFPEQAKSTIEIVSATNEIRTAITKTSTERTTTETALSKTQSTTTETELNTVDVVLTTTEQTTTEEVLTTTKTTTEVASTTTEATTEGSTSTSTTHLFTTIQTTTPSTTTTIETGDPFY